MKNGYRAKGHVTVEVEGKLVKVPVAQIKIVPPWGGTAAVKKPQSCRGMFRCNKPEAGEGLKMRKEQLNRLAEVLSSIGYWIESFDASHYHRITLTIGFPTDEVREGFTVPEPVALPGKMA